MELICIFLKDRILQIYMLAVLVSFVIFPSLLFHSMKSEFVLLASIILCPKGIAKTPAIQVSGGQCNQLAHGKHTQLEPFLYK